MDPIAVQWFRGEMAHRYQSCYSTLFTQGPRQRGPKKIQMWWDGASLDISRGARMDLEGWGYD